jgi:hypothetical protein
MKPETYAQLKRTIKHHITAEFALIPLILGALGFIPTLE